MRLIVWLLTLAFGLAGLAFREQGGIPHAHAAGTLLLALAFLSCPLLWRRDTGLFAVVGVRGKDRFFLSLAMLIGAPLMLPWPFWT